ncbi:MAG TPA: MBL fold metallo-hydrolase [Gemmatimonadaceae bacterium]|nr:MBL fold metallo-hydrolase [Gemmatimonadaceae bacterium]
MTTVRVLGCGDAFSSGGRLFPSFHVESKSATFLLDCGPTALLAMKRMGLDPDRLDSLLISHFHGDHTGGIPFLELELGIMRGRKRPLTVAGPPGVGARVQQIREALYPSLTPQQRIGMDFIEWAESGQVSVGELVVRTSAVVHTPATQPHALRVEVDGCVIAYSGDTEWTDALIPLAEGADLFICEASTFAIAVENHLSYQTLMAHRERLRCRRLLITHMSDDMLRVLPVEGAEAAEDGLTLVLQGG